MRYAIIDKGKGYGDRAGTSSIFEGIAAEIAFPFADAESFLLLSNSARGVMKISTQDMGRKEGITERVGGGGTAGQAYETVEEFKNVVQLDRLNDQSAVVVVQNDDGSQNLRTLALP